MNAFMILTPPANSRLITDNGTNFISKEFNRFLKQNNIQHFYTSTYHPQTNRLNEKVNHTVITRLKIAINEKPKRKWSTLLPEVIHSYNATIHLVTDFAPKYLLFGITDNTQIESNLAANRKLAFERTEAFKQKKKSKYDKTHKHINLEIGSLVKRRISSNHPTSNKFTSAYTCLYTSLNNPIIITKSKTRKTPRIQSSRLATGALFSKKWQCFRSRGMR
jgi:transposase InsO family protein